MSTLTVLKFPSANGAQQAQNTLLGPEKQQLSDVQDAAIVSWPRGKKPKTEQLHSPAGQAALTGTFWGMLLGVIFFVPFFGLALGAAVGALSAKFNDYGIDDSFIKQTRESVTEGTSALFLLTNGTVEDKVVAALKGQTFEIIATNLPKAKEVALRAAFGAA
jgi:uncharacterized membrane protein